MSMKYLGEQIDIHGGGKDLIFPHHENEIAQSESLTGKQFSKYWLHNGLIKVNGQKMSKSLNNGILLEDLLKEYNPEVIRISLLENNYRSDMNIIDGALLQHEIKIYNIYQTFSQIDSFRGDIIADSNSLEYQEIDKEFREAMDNDFNTSLAITYIFKWISEINKIINKRSKEDIKRMVNIREGLIKVYKVLGLLGQDASRVVKEIKDKYLKLYDISEEEILDKIEERKKYKENKEWDKADNVRAELLERGIEIKDSREKTEWNIVFPTKK